MSQLQKVTAYYLKDGAAVQVLAENALLQAEAAAAWDAWRQEALAKGWELFISPPTNGTYTRSMFRTPADQEYLVQAGAATAADVDNGTHQAGLAVDLDLEAIRSNGSGYTYSDLVAMARRHGFTNRVYAANGSEPWHFDTDPVGHGLFESVRAAVESIGNTAAQVSAAVARGLDTPQMAAIKAHALGIGLGVAMATLLIWAAIHQIGKVQHGPGGASSTANI